MYSLTRRRFLTLASLGVVNLALTRRVLANRDDYEDFLPPPSAWGRVISWQQAVRAGPSATARVQAYVGFDEIIPLYAQVEGTPPWPTNPTWYMTGGGFVHSGYVQPVGTTPNAEIVTEVEPPGFWAEVCLPYVRGRWDPDSPGQTRKLYYETVYRVVNAVQDSANTWWYQLEQGLTYNTPGAFVPASAMRRLTPQDLAPLAPGRDDKWMHLDIATETLICYEGDQPVFSTRTASGVWGMGTPLGEFEILHKRFGWRMVGDDYDLAGVPFPVYFTRSGVAIHGTYWHNDYGRRHSHGCVNVASRAARWVFRWVDPVADYSEGTVRAADGAGTRIVVT